MLTIFLVFKLHINKNIIHRNIIIHKNIFGHVLK